MSSPRRQPTPPPEDYRLLFERNPQPMWVLDAETLRFLAVNEAAIRHYGYSRKEFLAMSAQDIRPPEEASRLLEYLAKCTPGLNNAGVWRHQKKDGTPIDVEISHQLVTWAGKSAQLVLAHDVTERKRAEAELRRAELKHRSIFENATEGIFQTTEDGRYLTANPALARIYGYESPEELIRCVTDVGHQLYVDPRRREEHLRLLHQQGRVAGFESEQYRKDGTIIRISANSHAVFDTDGKLLHYEGTIQDVTERKRAERELRIRVREQAVVAQLGQRALPGLDLDTLFSESTALVARTLGNESCEILELLPDGKALLLRAGFGWKEGLVGQATVGAGIDSQGGYTLLSKEPVIAEDMQTETRFHCPPLLLDHGMVGGMTVIIQGHDRPFGVLGTHTAKRRRFSRDDVNFIQAVANVLAQAIERKQAESDIRSLLRISEKLNSTLDVEVLLDSLIIEAIKLTDTEIGWVGLRTEQGMVCHKYFRNLQPVPFEYCWPPGVGWPGWVLVHKAPYLSNDASVDDVIVPEIRERFGVKSGLDTPLLDMEGNVIGFIEVNNKKGSSGFGQSDIEKLLAVSRHASVAIQNALAYRETKQAEVALRQTTRELASANEALRAEIAERKRAEEALEESRRRLKALFDNSLDSILLVDDEGRYVDANPAACALLGYTREELLRLTVWDVIPAQTHELARKLWRKFIAGGRQSGEYTLLCKNGTTREVECRGVARILPGLHLGVNRDITVRKRLEEQFLQAQKMEAIGRLAAGVAHDFNNLLTGILGYVQFLRREPQDGDSRQRMVSEIEDAANRAKDLTAQLLAFGRKTILQPRALNLNSLISQTVDLLQRTLGEDIHIETSLDSELHEVTVDPVHLEQVILNLAVNARDAMPGGGTLTIGTENVHVDESFVTEQPTFTPGAYARLFVADTGSGMDTETLARAFEPFFTTKESGSGTGLGLSTVCGIIKQSGGNIAVNTTPGKGTRFDIYLPAATGQVPEQEQKGSEEIPLSGNETILLVEDADIVRRLVKEALTEKGFTVLEAKNGAEALQLAEKHEAPIHLVISDVVMPGMSGPDLVRRISEIRPETKALCITGYADRSTAEQMSRILRLPLLSKPFLPDDLVRQVFAVLRGAKRED